MIKKLKWMEIFKVVMVLCCIEKVLERVLLYLIYIYMCIKLKNIRKKVW